MSWVSLHAAAWRYWCGSRDSKEESPSSTDLALCDSALKKKGQLMWEAAHNP